MTNDKLNAYIDELLGNDQSRKMCKIPIRHELCVETYNESHDWDIQCGFRTDGLTWLDCPYRDIYTPPDYCGDWAAFGTLVEWCQEHLVSLLHYYVDDSGAWEVELTDAQAGLYKTVVPTLPLALARAVYGAMKGKP